MTILQSGVIPSTGGYQIERSLRFNSADSAYLNRTPASASNRRTWTYSFWVKRAKLSRQMFLGVYTSSSDVAVIEIESDQIYWYDYLTSSYRYELRTTQVLRDPSAWYHIMCVLDTTQATSSNRNKIYINGSLVTALTTATYPTQNLDGKFNTAVQHSIGTEGSNLRLFLDAYQTETYFIDGQALTPSSFGETDSNTGIWKPKAFSGTYGTNGFYLKFADNSGTTSTTLGKDYSGNGNNWTPNNFSVTAGAGNDSLVDSPTAYGTDTGVGGEVRGNYATLNPLASPVGTYSNGNLDWVGASGQWNTAASTIFASSGKYYFEVTAITVGTTNYFSIGAIQSTATYAQLTPNYLGNASVSWGFYWNGASSFKFNNSVSTTVASGTIVANDILQCAVDVDNGRIWFGRNNTWVEGSPSAGTGASFTNLTGSIGFGISIFGTAEKYTANFGQRAFAYTAPSGFKALCTTNLPTPTIGATSTTQANDYFNPVLYTGNGTSSNAITGVGFQPDFVWIKPRSLADHHRLTDAVRGVRKTLKTNLTDAESSNTANDLLYTFDSDGFTIGGSDSGWNGSGSTYVAWNWKANGAGSSNTAGTITSTVSANTTSGFSIVTYTGTGSNATVGHGLGVAPQMIIVKNRSSAQTWRVYSSVIGATQYLNLNATTAAQTSSIPWNNTAPTSTVFSVGTDDATNKSSENLVAYCFANVEGYSRAFSYTGNGSTDGVFVYLGFRPRFIMIKRTDTTADWVIYDSARDTYNVNTLTLYPNLSNAEGVVNPANDFLSNGFKARNSTSTFNASGGTYIGFAVAESPFKYSLGR